MLTTTSSYIVFGSVILFMFVCFCLTQKIYTRNWFSYLFAFSIILPIGLVVMTRNEKDVQVVWSSIIFLIYTSLLWLIKRYYKQINNYLIKKHFLEKKFISKDFTYVEDGDHGEYWNEELALEPSWLDKTMSFLLLILPLVILGIIALFTS